MALPSWSVIDATSFTPIAEEARGLRAKQWVRDPDGVEWLRKSPRSWRLTEPVIESLAARLAAAVGLTSPDTYGGVWTGERRGILVRRFGELDEELVEGSTLLARSSQDYNALDRSLHTLDAVGTCLASWEHQNTGARKLREQFAHMCAFDLWVGNSDRHQQNWGILLRGSQPTARMAPVYDTAACLCTELDDGKFTSGWSEERLNGYIERCRSGFGDGHEQIGMRPLAGVIRTWPEWQAHARKWHASFAGLIDDVSDWMDPVPVDWLPLSRRKVVGELLRRRLDWMTEFLP